MAINVEIQSEGILNLNHLTAMASEYYGEVTNRDAYSLYLHFSNNDYARQFKVVVAPYFSGKCVI